MVRTSEKLFSRCSSAAGYTKLANLLHAKELQKRLDAQGAPIIVTAIHPGGIMTGKRPVFLPTSNQIYNEALRWRLRNGQSLSNG